MKTKSIPEHIPQDFDACRKTGQKKSAGTIKTYAKPTYEADDARNCSAKALLVSHSRIRSIIGGAEYFLRYGIEDGWQEYGHQVFIMDLWMVVRCMVNWHIGVATDFQGMPS